MMTRPFSSQRLSSCRPTSSGSAPGRATRSTTIALSSSTDAARRVRGHGQRLGVERAQFLAQPDLELGRPGIAGDQHEALGGDRR